MNPFRLFSVTALVIVLLSAPAMNALAGPEKSNPQHTAKIATLAPDGTVWMKAIRMVATHVEEGSGGQYHARFFTGGVMGDEPDVVRKMKLGQLDGSAVSITGVRLTCPEFQVLEMPFLFGGAESDDAQAYQEAEHVLLALYNEFDQYAQKNGYRIIALGSAGLAHICAERPLENILRDFPQQKVWQWEGETVMKAISESLGVPSISLPLPDTLTALQTGMINAFYGTSLHVLAFQWDKYIKYIYEPAVFYTPSYVVVPEQAWQKLPQNIRALYFDEEATRIKKDSLRWIHDDDRKSLEILRSQGIQVLRIPPDQLAEMKTRTRRVWSGLSGKTFPAPLLERVEKILEEYRNSKRPGAAGG